ncbi:hypothetical protein [Geoalkalibacter halelectricus]|uniref:hypothetical protein n=1 Tax=Geoalkalibacter halelectricus TaxID=2847045 RepID=UPI003D1EB30C
MTDHLDKDYFADALHTVSEDLYRLGSKVRDLWHLSTQCSACQGPIMPGSAGIDIRRTVEYVENSCGQKTARILAVDVLAKFCASCGNAHSYPHIWRKRLAEKLDLTDCEAEEDVCSLCLKQLSASCVRVTLELMILQVGQEFPHDEGYKLSDIPIYADNILVFCPPCGSRMGRGHLQGIMNELLTAPEEK